MSFKINGAIIKRITLTAITLSLCLFANAEVYRYQDENGKWHFSDDKKLLEDKANTGADIEVVDINSNMNLVASLESRKTPAVFVPDKLCPSDNRPLTVPRGGYWGKPGNFFVETKKDNGKVSIFVTNNYFAPVSFKFWFEESSNMLSSKPLPLSSEIQAHKSYRLLGIEPEHGGLAWRYRYNYSYQLGRLNPTHSKSCYYLPPVPDDTAYKVSQGFSGDFSHNGDYSKYAVDITMPIGTDVVAARGGIIIERKTDFVLNGTHDKFKRRANVIRILHSDGTIGTYAHLEFRTMKFKEGELVQTGQVIGRSGNTGYSTGPHLHFVIHANINMHLTSVPFQFLNNSKVATPKKDMLLVNKPVVGI